MNGIEGTMNAGDTAARQSEEQQALIRARVLRVNALALSVVVGLLLGAGLLVMTFFLRLRDGPDAGPHLALLGQFLPGYKVTYLGGLIGFFWVFLIGFAATFAGCSIYNAIASHRARKWE